GPSTSNAPARPDVQFQVNTNDPPRFRIQSLFDLVDVRVEIKKTGKSTPTNWLSPLDSHSESFAEQFDKISEYVTTVPLPRVPGRINVDVAPREILMTIPGIEETVVDEILAKRESSNERGGDNKKRSLTWLLTEQVASLEVLRKIAPYITVGGD